MSPKLKAIIYVLICVTFWALIPVVSKLGQSSLNNHQFLFWSSLCSLITFLILLIYTKKISAFKELSIKKWIQSITLGFIGTYLYYILLYYGYANANGLEVLIIQYFWPIFVILLSVILLKEKINIKKIAALIFGFSGVLLILSKGNLKDLHFDNLTINLIVLLAAFSAGLFSVLSKKIEIDTIVLVSIYFLVATISSFISMLFLSNFKLPSQETIVPILINGILVNGISYLLWIKALREVDASFIAPYIFLTPVLSAILLVVFFKEPFQPIYYAGMGCVIFGGLINSIKGSSKN